jgi:hypothetical protein
VRGVYVPGFLALPVVQQPSGSSGYVSRKAETATQFQLAARYNVIGLQGSPPTRSSTSFIKASIT